MIFVLFEKQYATSY